jgi:dienelactone hydrolase
MYYENSKGNQAVNVILVHGWRMKSNGKIDNIYLRPFMNFGFNIYHFTQPYHHKREPENSLYSGELMVTADIDRTLQSVKQAISDVRALINWLKENRPGKIIIIGISLGGFISNLAATVEKNIDALISVFYANSIAYSIWNTKPGIYIKKDFEQNGFTYGELKDAWAITTPSNFKPLIPKENILLFSGIYDQYVVGKDTDKLWESWDRPKRIMYPWGHAGIVFCKKKIANESVEFLKERILD